MPNVPIKFHSAAVAEVEAAVKWYAERSPIAAGAFAAEVDACIERVQEAPGRWPRYVHGTRRYLFPHFPFSLVYRVLNDEIEIVAVSHHKRRPGYWKGR
ncbi:MAG: type II toxin-antitoxin system RelE/ParE family toxin [Planctomycetaceae bacterium]